MSQHDPITALCNTVMQAVVRSGAIRRGVDADIEVGIRVMREEVKAFIAGPAYADERALALTGGHQLAMSSLLASCVARILAERPAA